MVSAIAGISQLASVSSMHAPAVSQPRIFRLRGVVPLMVIASFLDNMVER
jgi:hypothetical protein